MPLLLGLQFEGFCGGGLMSLRF